MVINGIPALGGLAVTRLVRSSLCNVYGTYSLTVSQQQIRWFQVAVDDFIGVHVFQRGQELCNNGHSLFFCQGSVLLHKNTSDIMFQA